MLKGVLHISVGIRGTVNRGARTGIGGLSIFRPILNGKSARSKYFPALPEHPAPITHLKFVGVWQSRNGCLPIAYRGKKIDRLQAQKF